MTNTSGATSGHQFLTSDIPDRVAARFWSKVLKTDHCWLWTASLNPGGYGMIGWSGENGPELHTAHRVAYVLTRGDIPAGLVVRNTCGSKSCVRPEHLEVVTHAANMRLALSVQTRLGMNMRHAQEIRTLAAAGMSDAEIAPQFGISKMRVASIRLNQTWRDPDYQPIRRSGGQDAYCAKLTDGDVAEARRQHAEGKSVRSLALAYGVALSTMWDAIHGKSWSHVPMSG